LIGGAFCVAAAAGGCTVLRTGFETDPAETGWRGARSYPYKTEFAGRWSDEEACSGKRCLVVAGGMWESPDFPLTPFGFYRVRFASKTRQKAYWLVRFFDKSGREIGADHYSSVDPSVGWRRNESFLMARAGTATGRIAFRPINSPVSIDDVTVARATRSGVLAWIDSLYRTVPPVRYTPAPHRSKHLPRTMETLRRRGRLRIVVLGDSIANDLCNSHFHLLVERMYPGSRITLIHSIRSGTGCRWYQHADRVQDYVIDHKPDLLVIAGISNGPLEAIRSVIRQVRRKIDPEILVAIPVRDKGRETLLAAAETDRFAWMDTRRPWQEYLERSPHPPEWYLRDRLHANDRGKQVQGRIFARFFAPDAAETGGRPPGRPATGHASDRHSRATVIATGR